jgi:cytoskeletal protein CcmA (bactofilin family)
MFRRRKPTEEAPERTPELVDELDLPVKPNVRPAAAGPMRPPVLPPRAPAEAQRASSEVPRRLDGAAAPASAAGSAGKREAEMRKLIVGREISLSGEITSCDRLVVEGSVEANLANCRDIEISESGVFKGSASIEDAEVRGRFEGVLNVRRRLLIRASGRIVGTVRYGQIEIECGGQISGDIQAQPTVNEPPPPAIEVRPLLEASSGDGHSE